MAYQRGEDNERGMVGALLQAESLAALRDVRALVHAFAKARR